MLELTGEFRKEPLPRLIFEEHPARGTVKEDLFCFFRPVFPRGLGRNLGALQKLLGQSAIKGANFRVSTVPGQDGTLFEGESGVRDNFCRVRDEARAKTRAIKAGAFGTIKGKVPWGELGNGGACFRVGGVGLKY